MTREDFENAKYDAVEALIGSAENISAAGFVDYDTDEDLEATIDEAEADLKWIEYCVSDFKEKVWQLKEFRREERKIEEE